MKVLLVIALAIAAVFVGPWLVMLCLDAANHYDQRVPDFGYWTCLWLFLAVRVATEDRS